MTDADRAAETSEVDAGSFSAWIAATTVAIRTGAAADVPCGGCTACCTSSQFVHIAPDERETLARIPAELLFPAPGLPRGHVLLGYDENGHCPMFVDGRCSIYEDRPRTCRTYDCRVFVAAGVTPDADKPRIAEQAARWRFLEESDSDASRREAVRAAAAFLAGHADRLPPGVAPRGSTQRAALAVDLHELFLDESGAVVTPAPDEVVAACAARSARR